MVVTLLFLSAAAFLGGFIDSIAGGGGLIGLPALLAVLPPHLALGTNKFQSMCGTTFGLANFARKSKVVWKVAFVGIPFALLGSVIGAKLTLVISSSILSKIMIALIPPAAGLVFFSKFLMKHKEEYEGIKKRSLFLVTPAVCLVVGAYDGFFGPGTGTFLILALAIFSKLPLVNASATAKTFNLASNVGAFAIFLISGQVYLFYGIIMAAANIAGNLTGSHFAMKRGGNFINKMLAISLTLLFIYLLWKNF